MADGDAGPGRAAVRHWLVGNVPAAALRAGGDLLGAEPLSVYRGPRPPPGSGFHSYQFLLFEQPRPALPFAALPERADGRATGPWDVQSCAPAPARGSLYAAVANEVPRPGAVVDEWGLGAPVRPSGALALRACKGRPAEAGAWSIGGGIPLRGRG